MSSGAALPLFAYGVLIDADVRAHILGGAGRRFAIAPASLTGYARVFAPGGNYPVLCPAVGDRVDGVLLRGVSRAQLARLTHWEGVGYRLATRAVESAGATVDARVYLPRVAPCRGRPWDFEDWRRRCKRRFLASLR